MLSEQFFDRKSLELLGKLFALPLLSLPERVCELEP
jgi:hypothetical protein